MSNPIAVQVSGPFVTESSARFFVERLLSKDDLGAFAVAAIGHDLAFEGDFDADGAALFRALGDVLHPESARPTVARVAADLLEAAKGRIFHGCSSTTEQRVEQVEIRFVSGGAWGAAIEAAGGYPSRAVARAATLEALRAEALAEIEKLRRPGDHPADVEQTSANGGGTSALSAGLRAIDQQDEEG